MFLPPGFNRKKNPSPNLGLLMARLYEFRFSIKCHTFRAVSVELCWLYSPRPSAWPWFILQKYTAGSLCFHQHSFPKNTAAQPGLDSKPITGLWCWIWWVVWCVVSPPIFPSSLSLCWSDSHHLGDLAQKAATAWCGWYGQEARTFCVG